MDDARVNDHNTPDEALRIDGRRTTYGPAEAPASHYAGEIGDPGEYPFTRGIHATGYRGKMWTMRMFAGFGSATETNQRFRYLLSEGQTGLSIAFDLPTLMGLDSDAPDAIGEFGRCGVAVSSLADMETLLDGLPLDRVTTSMTINSPAAPIWAMYIAAAEKRGVSRKQLAGTLQNDILKEFVAQKEFLYPPDPSMRLVTDTIEFGSREMPLWNTISISGYHIREAGATAAQELAFTLADGIAYVRACLDRGLAIDEFAPRLSFFFNCHSDFFEEVAKFRAARRIWARLMREEFGAKEPRSWWMRFHTQTSGVSLTAQQPEVNVVRTALQALAAVMGGTQSLHTNSLDEALALPSENAARLALRTQQVLAHETAVAETVDPLGGSYFVESLTDAIETEARSYLARIDELGGAVRAIESGYMQREIADAAYRHQAEIEAGARVIVGVNRYATDEAVNVPVLRMDEQAYERQVSALRRLRRERSDREAARALREVGAACRAGTNVMPPLLDAVNAYATLGEMCAAMREVFGVYQETAYV